MAHEINYADILHFHSVFGVIDPVAGTPVITSYSIHYTKLYDKKLYTATARTSRITTLPTTVIYAQIPSEVFAKIPKDDFG